MKKFLVLMLGEYEDRDVAFVSTDLEQFKFITKMSIENWLLVNRLCDYYPSDIIVIDENGFQKEFVLWEYIDFDKPDKKDFDRLFKDIEDYAKGE